MLEKVMELHFLLYAMMLMGGLGALGMLTTHLTYRRMIRKNTEVKSNLKEKWTNLWKTRDRLLNRMNRFVWYPSLFCIAFLGLAATSSCGMAYMWEELYIAASNRLPLALALVNRALSGPININCDHSDSIAFAETGAGFYIQRRTSDEFFF